MSNERVVMNDWFLPNVEVECSALLLHIREVLCSNLGPEIDYRGWRSSSVHSSKWMVFKSGYENILPHPFQFIIYHSTIRHYRPVVWATDRFVKQTTQTEINERDWYFAYFLYSEKNKRRLMDHLVVFHLSLLGNGSVQSSRGNDCTCDEGRGVIYEVHVVWNNFSWKERRLFFS
jgi:hypothetical protein